MSYFLYSMVSELFCISECHVKEGFIGNQSGSATAHVSHSNYRLDAVYKV